MVRSAGVNGLLKVTVKPVAVGVKPRDHQALDGDGALKPLMGGVVAVVSLAMIVVPAGQRLCSVTLKVCTPLSPARSNV